MTDIVDRLLQDLAPTMTEAVCPVSLLREAAEEIGRLRVALEYRIAERDMWNRDARRLSGGLLKIRSAPDHVPASVLREIAYDIALNCLPPDVAEYQIERRSAALNIHEQATKQGSP